MNKVVAVVVTYNRLDKLKRCLAALSESDTPCDVLVVDNASTDGTSEWLASFSSETVCVINTGKNIGGAGGFNLGMRKAVGMGYEFIWLMDDDCMAHRESLSRLLDADRILSGDYGWLSSVALWTDGRPCKMNKQKAVADFYDYADLLGYSLLAATQATFVSLFIRSSVVRKFGLPITDFFIWGDDVEFTRRIAVRGGLRSFVVGNSVVTHEMKDNNGSSIALDGQERIQRYRYAYRNEAYLYRQEGARGIAYFIAKCGLNIFRTIRYHRPRTFSRLRVLVSSAISGFFFNPKVETL